MGVTVEDVESNVRSQLDDPTAKVLTSEEFLLYLNKIVEEFNAKVPEYAWWDEQTVTTVAGTAAYDLSASFQGIVNEQPVIIASTKKPLDPITVKRWQDLQYLEQVRGEPIRNAIRQKAQSENYEMLFHPAPDAVYSLTFPAKVKFPAITAVDTTVLPYPVEFLQFSYFAIAERFYNKEGELRNASFSAQNRQLHESKLMAAMGETTIGTAQDQATARLPLLEAGNFGSTDVGDTSDPLDLVP